MVNVIHGLIVEGLGVPVYILGEKSTRRDNRHGPNRTRVTAASKFNPVLYEETPLPSYFTLRQSLLG